MNSCSCSPQSNHYTTSMLSCTFALINASDDEHMSLGRGTCPLWPFPALSCSFKKKNSSHPVFFLSALTWSQRAVCFCRLNEQQKKNGRCCAHILPLPRFCMLCSVPLLHTSIHSSSVSNLQSVVIRERVSGGDEMESDTARLFPSRRDDQPR